MDEMNLRRQLAERAAANLKIYYEIVDLLESVPPNQELLDWISHMRDVLGTLEDRYVVHYETMDLQEIRQRRRIIDGFVALSSRYKEVERGFFSQIKDDDLHASIREMFKSAEPLWADMYELCEQIPSVEAHASGAA